MTLGDKLSRLRKENNFTQEQLADLLGVSRQAISKWESIISAHADNYRHHISSLFEKLCAPLHCGKGNMVR